MLPKRVYTMSGYRIWNLSDLKADLSAGQLSEHRTFRYFLAYAFFHGGVVGASLMHILAGFAGPYYCYRKNGGASGVNFLGKFFSLWLVCSVRIVLVFGLVWIVLYYGLPLSIQNSKFIMGADLIFLIIQYYFIGKCIGDTKAT